MVVDQIQTTSKGNLLEVAYELARSLGLVDGGTRSNVAAGVPNLMGDGPLRDRLGPLGLNRHQIARLRTSPLVRLELSALSKRTPNALP